MDQHIISGWLLRAFARGPLVAFAKDTGAYSTVDAKTFMTERDAHPVVIEQGIAKVEGPASSAALTLAKRAKQLPCGLYAVSHGESVSFNGPPGVADKGVFEGMRLLVGEREIASPKPSERVALARYAGLMYQRNPLVEEAMLAWGRAFDLGAQRALDTVLPGYHTGVKTELSHRRARMLEVAANIGDRLVEANWWLVVAGPEEAFILGDAPVAATLALGHEDEWRAIFAPESYIVAMPLSPRIALLMAPQKLMPISGIDFPLTGLVLAINRLMWRRASGHVLGRDLSHLRAVWADAESARTRASVDAVSDAQEGFNAGWRIGLSVGVEADFRYRVLPRWQRWEACSLKFGWSEWAPADRDGFMPRCPARVTSEPSVVRSTLRPMPR